MPTESSPSPARPAARHPLAVAAGALIFVISTMANAAIQAEAANEGSSFLPVYGITLLLVIVLISLFVYKRIRSMRDARPADPRKPARVERSEAHAAAATEQ